MPTVTENYKQYNAEEEKKKDILNEGFQGTRFTKAEDDEGKSTIEFGRLADRTLGWFATEDRNFIPEEARNPD